MSFKTAHCISIFLLICLMQESFAQVNNPVRNKNVTVTTEREGDALQVRAHNKNPYSITLTVQIAGQNFKAEESLPAVRVISPRSTLKVVRLTRKEEERDMNISVQSSWIIGNVRATHDDNYIYRLPYRSNRSFKVGQSHNGVFSHHGSSRFAIDFMMEIGTPVVAAREGVVIQTVEKYSRGGTSEEFRNKANQVYIEHGDGTFGEYAHLKQNGVLVNVGTYVQKGQVIGISGNTGFSSGPHLHFSVSKVVAEDSTMSLPVKIRTEEGIFVKLEEGKKYTAL